MGSISATIDKRILSTSCHRSYCITPFFHELNTLDACWIAVDVWSNSSRCRQESFYYSWTWGLCNDHCLDIVMIIWSSINCPTVICLPTVCYFSWEKPLVKPTAPGSSFSYICLRSTFPLHFLFRSIKPKIQKYFAVIYLLRSLFILSTTFTSRYLPIMRRRTWKGLTTPLTRRVASICYLCAGAVYVVLLGFPTGSITLISSLR